MSFFDARERGEDISARLAVGIGGFSVGAYFVGPDEICFSFAASEVDGGEDFAALGDFMVSIAAV